MSMWWWGEGEWGQWASDPSGVAMGTEPLNIKSLSNFAVEHDEGAAQGGLTAQESYLKELLYSYCTLGSAAHSSGPVENTWELWLFSHGHSRGNQKS